MKLEFGIKHSDMNLPVQSGYKVDNRHLALGNSAILVNCHILLISSIFQLVLFKYVIVSLMYFINVMYSCCTT